MSTEAQLHAVLEKSRKNLLDLSARNRLINTPRSSTRSTRLEIVDALSEQVFKRLVTEGKSMYFLPRGDDSSEALAEPNDSDGAGEPGELSDVPVARSHQAYCDDDKLQTRLESESLQKRLLKLLYDARTHEEEQGVNILYLALGFLKWYEDDKSDRERQAPLILIPVTLSRPSAGSKFKLAYNEDELATNLSLQARIKDDFGIQIPDLPDVDELSPQDYFDQVSQAISGQSRWEVLPNDMVLWFFSFSKFLMYRDLQPENWPADRALESNSIIRGLLSESFVSEPPLCGDDGKVDEVITPSQAVHVVDADSSQAVAIEEVKRGRNLVIQGPPGTGKSQTIANLIAAAVVSGKSVLFVAEKMAALEVVHRRLANVGLGDMCLELHCNKANKKAVLQELAAALALGKPAGDNVEQVCHDLTSCRERLNRHLDLIHGPIAPSGFTPFQMVGELVRLRATKTRPPGFQLERPEKWTRRELEHRLHLLRDLAEFVEQIGQPDLNPWRGARLEVVLPTDV
ncbi:MAG: DUF4011 domain-containing protein, partial [Planctomycetales bacterium]|nr:DUF4011 domain-containing protein [Planctomycetales bacterium]